jgi:signal transduction histidine kinase/DNA-binding response OmpR family regulator
VNERSLVRQGVRSVVHALRLRGPLAADPTARILHALVLALAIWSAIWTIATLPLYPNLMARLLRVRFVMVADLVPVTTLILLRLGHFRQASYIYLAGQWVHATYNIAINGSIQITSTAFYITLPILATWLLGFREAFWTAGVCLGSALILLLRQGPVSVLPTAPLRLPLLIWANLVQLTLTAAAPVAHILQTLRETLAQSRSDQEELQQYKERLEQVVEQRTAELVVARDQALAASRAKSAFLANMSHELRTPLNAILGFSSLLRDGGASEQQRHDLDIINRSGEHLLGLINDVLDVAKVEAGRSKLEATVCDVGRLIEDVKDMAGPGALQKGLALRVERPPAPLFVRTDPSRLRQVLINLLNNAVKFTDRGSVTLRMKATPAIDTGEVLLTFEVEDTGEGIAARDQAAIFDAFVQASAAKRHEGAGLGLTISREIIELMGGTIQVESVHGQGSRFRTEIKVELAQESEVKRGSNLERVTALAEGQPEYRILIVEDQRENWMVLERLLANAGFRVRVAENGAQGVKEFREWRPQFIWMDLRMPVMDGVEATRRIRACEGGHEVKIAAVTASGYASERSRILAGGMDDYVRKPYRPVEIFECMARHLGVRYQVSEGAAKSDSERAGELSAEDLSALPDELRKELRDALIMLDPAPISTAIERISQENRALGLILAGYADVYAYSKIFDAMTEGEAKAKAVPLPIAVVDSVTPALDAGRLSC